MSSQKYFVNVEVSNHLIATQCFQISTFWKLSIIFKRFIIILLKLKVSDSCDSYVRRYEFIVAFYQSISCWNFSFVIFFKLVRNVQLVYILFSCFKHLPWFVGGKTFFYYFQTFRKDCILSLVAVRYNTLV